MERMTVCLRLTMGCWMTVEILGKL